MEKMFDKVAIIGLGLLGGSLAKAMKAGGLANEITGCGRTAQRLEYALKNGIADSVTNDPVECVNDADFIVIGTPVGIIPDVIERISGKLRPGAVVTDLGSTKQYIVEKAESAFPEGVYFVGSHPMAGSENSGIEASDPLLFENALCVVTSSTRTEMAALKKVETLWETLKCRVMVMTPQEHDFLVAAASHLPHIAAVSLCWTVSSLSEVSEKVMPLLAGGFRDTTRVASGSPEVWHDICDANRDFIGDMIDSYIDKLGEVKKAIGSNDSGAMTDIFALAKKFRDEVPQRGIGALMSDYELIVDVMDRPGIIGEVATALGAESINIKNMNIQHIRELGGGTLLLVLEKEDDIGRAIEVLEKSGFKAKRK